MSEQQVLNYLLWLKDRGQHFFVPAGPTKVDRPQDEVAPESDAQEISSLVSVVFLSSSPLNAAEHEMVSRIASALSLKPEHFIIVSGDAGNSLQTYNVASIVVMGEDADELVAGLSNPKSLIPHPRAMLAEPSLKVSAWGILQKLKFKP